MSLQSELRSAAYKAGGSTKTRDAREKTVADFASWCRENNIQIPHARQVRAKYIGAYIDALVDAGISKRTCQNRMAHLRTTLSEASNRHKMPTNQQLGIDGASRLGARTAMTDETFHAACSALSAQDKEPARAALTLQRELGLRSGEAIMAWRSLKTWETQLRNGADFVMVRHGTKGGRARKSHVIDRQRALAAVQKALAITKANRNRLIRGSTLQSARSAYQRDCRSVGLLGKQAPHSARYAYAREQFHRYCAAGYTPREAKSAVAQDLGHGPGRDRWVNSVYLR